MMNNSMCVVRRSVAIEPGFGGLRGRFVTGGLCRAPPVSIMPCNDPEKPDIGLEALAFVDAADHPLAAETL
jgi:hypothetical protein